MGLLKVGQPLRWQETVPHSRYVREHGVTQFLHTYERMKDVADDPLLYGDEVEYSVLTLDTKEREVRIALRGCEIMADLNEREKHSDSSNGRGCTWHQEYGSWMLEGTPALPFGAYASSLLEVEWSMRLRRARLLSALGPNEISPTVVSFPLMGVGDFVRPAAPPGGPSSLSDYVPDTCINPHPRFGTLTANIRSRRGSKVDVRVPVFQDEATEAASEIEMDCMAFGMGCCCLQVTFQGRDMEEARHLYDQLAPLTPILMALTSATPILRGKLAGIDARWQVISGSVDDRTPAERSVPGASTAPDPRMAGGGVRPLSKSRYESISAYISHHANASHELSAHYNDVPCEIDEKTQATLLMEGIDEHLAQHIAHLFARDPLVMFDGSISEVDDSSSMEHFESLNSTNWQTMRFKPPPVRKSGAPHIGWRTEFRPMEVQLTDFENAAFTAFVVLLSRAILVFDLDFLAPLSKVDENMQRAHAIDAVNQKLFWFRSDVTVEQTSNAPSNELYEEMSMEEIVCGKKDSSFPGLVPLCYAYLDHIDCDAQSFARINEYLIFIKRRASGELMTPATWMRRFVRAHPEYKNDSVVSQGIAFDLMRACDDIGTGVLRCPELHGDVVIEPISGVQAWGTHLLNARSSSAKGKLLKSLEKQRLRNEKQDSPGTSTVSTPSACDCRSFCRDCECAESDFKATCGNAVVAGA